MRSKYILITVVLLTLGFGLGRLSAAPGTLDSPDVPGNTQSYTLEDIYNRLDSAAAGAQSTFTEPAVAPGTGTMHTLNEIMGKAPAKDDTNGATKADVANGKTFWGLNVAVGEWGLQTGTAAAGGGAGVPKTGQTTEYADGDDGDLQKGVAWPSPRFTDNQNGTVTDNLTGLIWLKDANCAAATRDWTTALSDVAGLNSTGKMNGNDCGDTSSGGSHQTDWRLPNVREMQSLIHYGISNPALPNTLGTGQWLEEDPFTNVQRGVSPSEGYWSSTTGADSPDVAYSAWMWTGLAFGGKKLVEPRYVWPVRGGQ